MTRIRLRQWRKPSESVVSVRASAVIVKTAPVQCTKALSRLDPEASQGLRRRDGREEESG